MTGSAIEHNGHTWALDERNPPHVIKDGEDNGVAIQGEEALWSEVVSLRAALQRVDGMLAAERLYGPSGRPSVAGAREIIHAALAGGVA